MKKEARYPTINSFYIIEDKIYYSTEEGGLPHQDLWEYVVKEAFPTLAYDNKKDLMNHPYGIDRGRVVYQGTLDPRGRPQGEGKYILYVTPGAVKHVDKLKRNFFLKKLPEDRLEVNTTDEHYRIQKADTKVVEDMVRLVGGKDKLNLRDVKVAFNFDEKIVKAKELKAKIREALVKGK